LLKALQQEQGGQVSDINSGGVRFETAEHRHLTAMQILFKKNLARDPKLSVMKDCIDSAPSQVAIVDGEVVGFVYSHMVAPDTLELVNILVAEDRRDSGIGGNLLERLEREAFAQGYKAVILFNSLLYSSAGIKRAATPFYSRHGYDYLRLTNDTVLCWKLLP
jgi:N-acetylglutamate synthase-like GNAT family acetyltransferase